jgi:hypothetical protein
MAGSTLAQMKTKVSSVIKLYPVNAGSAIATRCDERVVEAKKHLMGIFSWWYARDGATAPDDTTGMTDQFELMWYQLSLSLAYPLVGKLDLAAAMTKAFTENFKTFMELDNMTS